MKTKVKELINRQNVDELTSYLNDLPEGMPLDYPEEKMMLEQFCEPVVKTYFKRFAFSERALCLFLTKAPQPMRRAYINRYGLPVSVQKYVIDNNMIDVANDYCVMHFFDDVDYLLDNGSAEFIRLHITRVKLNSDTQVLKVLHHKNSSLFSTYVSKGYFISEKILNTIIDEHNVKALRCVLARQYRWFKKLTEKYTIEEIRKNHADEAILPEELQIAILEGFEPRMTELLLKYSPLWEKAQKFMITHNFDAHWLKLHVSHLYAMGGYRFTPELEPALFQALSLKGMDDCLTQFRQHDDKMFVQYASPEATIKYIKNFWLTDEAQVVVFLRGNVDIMDALIGRFTPEHGMCWQAEVQMVKVCSPDTIKKYISFHTMCREALELLHKRLPETFEYYFTKHQY